jgi:hypothetical protein
LARAAAYIYPKYVYGEERSKFPRSAECFGEVVQDLHRGTLKGSPDDRAALQTDILLETANFRKLRGWFASDAAKRVATVKSEFDFWTTAAQYDDAKNVSSLAQKLLTSYSSMGEVERCHKLELTARHRTTYSNRKMAASTEAYREIAIAKSNKTRKKKSSREEQNVMGAFRDGMQAAVKRRKEQEAAAQSIAEARESINDSEDDTPPHNEFHDILDEICAETE